MERRSIPAIAFVGYSGSGKTTLIEKLLPLFTAKGLRVATIKHHHGEFEPDRPGKDSYRHRKAGAHLTILAAARRLFLVEELEMDQPVEEIIARYALKADLCIVEGFKRANLPKIEILKPHGSSEPLFGKDPMVVAVISDDPVKANVPVFGTKDLQALFLFIIERLFP
jgi:molybdopterin-guanine dinucleotide biosynthesis adapter protein